MIPGTPLLAIYDATGVVRVFEYTAGDFVQIASQGGFTQSSGPDGGTYPFMAWDHNQLVMMRVAAPGVIRTELLDILLSSIAQGNQSVSQAISYKPGFARDARLLTAMQGTGGTAQFRKIKLGDGTLTPEIHASLGAAGASIATVAASPAGDRWPLLMGTSIRNVVNPGVGQSFVNEGVRSGVPASLGGWDATGLYFVAGAPGETFATVFRYNVDSPEGYDEVFRIENTDGGTLVTLATEPYGKQLAIGWLNGGLYETRIYRRVGPFYVYDQTLPGAGRLLSFSANGDILIDAASRKVFVRIEGDDSYVEDTGANANLPTGTVMQAMSDHAPSVIASANNYDAGLNLLMSGTFDPASLKLTIAGETAPAYDISDATLAEAIGTAEIATGGWPAGGLPLTGTVVSSGGAGVVKLSGNPFERIIITSAIQFRYAFLHSNGVPIVRYDFQRNVSVQKDLKVIFDIPASGILTVVS